MSESTLEQVKRMAQGLRLGDRMTLVDELAHSLGQESADDEQKAQSLRGSWCGKFPENVDIESALHEIRHEWEEELLDTAPATQRQEGSGC